MRVKGVSSGILLYRRVADRLEVFLVHPGGPFWANRDEGAWSVPKGARSGDETSLETARREFREETGFAVAGPFEALTPVRQKGGKVVEAFAAEGDCAPSDLESNTFQIEWPRGSGVMTSFPEVDRAGWFGLIEARAKINPAQVALLDELSARLGNGGGA